MRRIKKIFAAIKSRRFIKIAWFIAILSLTLFTWRKVHSYFLFKNTDEQNSEVKISKENSIKEFASLLKLDNEDNFFTPGLPTITNTLYVNTKNKTLLFQSKPNEKPVVIEYESINELIKK